MKRIVLAVALSSTLLLSGCGAAGEEDDAKQNISTSLMKQQSDADMMALEQKDADCIAEDMVDGIGVEQLTEYGFLEADGTVNDNLENLEMSQEDAETMADSMFDCTDAMKTVQEQLEASFGAQDAEVKKCFDEALTEDVVRGMLVATFTGEQTGEEAQKLVAPIMECATKGAGGATQ